MLDTPLTAFTHAGGCACKLPQPGLNELLQVFRFLDNRLCLTDGITERHQAVRFPDDAATFSVTPGTPTVLSIDFITPVVDDPFVFGQIAAAHALSDIYAMGSTPESALAILGLPASLLPPRIGSQILAGLLSKCSEAGVSILCGHTADLSEPLAGLCVWGVSDRGRIIHNRGACEGDYLLLTKPLGGGIAVTAYKKAGRQVGRRAQLDR